MDTTATMVAGTAILAMIAMLRNPNSMSCLQCNFFLIMMSTVQSLRICAFFEFRTAQNALNRPARPVKSPTIGGVRVGDGHGVVGSSQPRSLRVQRRTLQLCPAIAPAFETASILQGRDHFLH